MMLKMTIVTLLMMAGLLGQSGASDAKTLKDDNNMVPGFNFVKNGFRKVAMSASNGALGGYQTIRNTSAWRPTFGDNFTAISQTVTFPDLKVFYNNTKASYNLLRSSGQMIAGLGASSFTLTMNATSGGNDTCQIDLQVLLNNLNLNIDLSKLGLVGALIGGLLAVLSGLTTLLVGILSAVLATLLTILVGQDVANMVDLDALCKMLLASNETSFPEPSL